MDAGLAQLCFSERLHFLSGSVLPDEKDDKREEEAACLRVWDKYWVREPSAGIL